MDFVKEIEVLKMTAKFNLRTIKNCKEFTKLYYVVNYAGKQIKLPTSIKIKPQHWDNNKQCALISTALNEVENIYNGKINKEIQRLKFAFMECKDYICANPNQMDFVKEYLYKYCTNIDKTMSKKENALIRLRTLINEKQIAESSKREYQYVIDDFEEFIKSIKGNKILYWDEINEKLIKDYKKYLQNKTEIHPITKEKVNQTDKYISERIKKIGNIINLAYNEDIINTKLDVERIAKLESKKKGNEEKLIALTEEEINKLVGLELKGKKAEIRDLFIFQFLTGQRYNAINGKEINKDNYTIIGDKTGSSTNIKPLVENDIRLQNILNRYNYKLPINNTTQANATLKELGQLIGMNEEVLCTEMRGGKLYKYTAKRWQLLGTHTAKRTFVTTANEKGIDDYTIMAVTGNKSVTTFQRYKRRNNTESRIEEFAKLYNDKANDSNATNVTEATANFKESNTISLDDSNYINNHIKELSKCKYPISDVNNVKNNIISYNGITEGIKYYSDYLEEMHNKTMHILMQMLNTPQIIKKYLNDIEEVYNNFYDINVIPTYEYLQCIRMEYKPPRTKAQIHDLKLTQYIISMNGVQREFQEKLINSIKILIN